jgi:hypothetical protein
MLTSPQDELLVKGVEKYGRQWTQITREMLPRRTGLAAKNR